MTPAADAPPARHELALWANDRRVATLGYAPLEDRWSLRYDPSWVGSPQAFALSPALPFEAAEGYSTGAVKRFVENLLPEGRALDVAATTYRVSKSNLYALISALGTETTGAFRFWRPNEVPPRIAVAPPREVTRAELDRRLAERDAVPLALWDGKVRMSIAGVQDKLMVYLDRAIEDGGRMFLVEPPLASTHILKPEPDRQATPHLVVNEHFCMSLARCMQLPTAQVDIYRTPRPVLVVGRFDRVLTHGDAGATVQRLHIIDACQAADLPVTYKYERNFGGGEHVRNIREGVSFEVLFKCVEQIFPDRVVKHPRGREHPKLTADVRAVAQPLDYHSFQEAPLSADLLTGKSIPRNQLRDRFFRHPKECSDLGERQNLAPGQIVTRLGFRMRHGNSPGARNKRSFNRPTLPRGIHP